MHVTAKSASTTGFDSSSAPRSWAGCKMQIILQSVHISFTVFFELQAEVLQGALSATLTKHESIVQKDGHLEYKLHSKHT